VNSELAGSMSYWWKSMITALAMSASSPPGADKLQDWCKMSHRQLNDIEWPRSSESKELAGELGGILAVEAITLNSFMQNPLGYGEKKT
jgi:hypothetical protein